MRYDREKRRRSIRLKGYDYSREGAYFVTICTQDRLCLFGEVVDGQMRLNEAGQVAEQCWRDIPAHFPHVALDAFVVMPNHVHGIVVITNPPVGANDVGANDVGANDVGANDVGANDYSPLPLPPHSSPHSPQRPLFRSPSKTVGSIIRGFKIGVTKWFRENTDIYPVWQRNYYEHIVRNEESLNRIREYIINNPLRWDTDRENPHRVGDDDFDEWLKSHLLTNPPTTGTTRRGSRCWWKDGIRRATTLRRAPGGAHLRQH